MKRFFKVFFSRLLIVISAIFITLVILEIAVRLFMPQQLIILRPDVWIPVDTGQGHRHNANLDTRINTGEREVRLLTDANGYRIGATPQEDPAIRILALGDSFLAALQVEYEQTMLALLENMLSEELGQTVAITNTGVDGYDPNHYLINARYELPNHDYDLALVFVYVANDIIYERIDSFPPRAPALRHYFRWPHNLSKRELVDAFFYPANDFLEERSHLYVLFKDRARVLLAKVGMTARYFPSVMLTTSANSESWDTTADALADIAKEVNDIPTVFVVLPASYQVDENEFEQYVASFNVDRELVDLDQPQRILIAKLEERGLTVIDLLPMLREANDNETDKLYGHVDTHFSPTGHVLASNYMMPFIRQSLEKSIDR